MAKIYVASSWRNSFQQDVVKFLRDAGHEVYDFKNPPHGCGGFRWSDIDPNWDLWTTEQYREALNHPIAQRGFDSDFNGMQWADVCVMVLPCGRSANTEAGWMKGAGKRVMVYSPKEQEPELMYKIYDFVSDSMFRINDEIKSGCSEKPNDQKADAGEICGNCDAYCECALGPNGAKHDNPACEYFDDSVLSQLNKNIHEK